jgi:predicted transcriptional regulator
MQPMHEEVRMLRHMTVISTQEGSQAHEAEVYERQAH